MGKGIKLGLLNINNVDYEAITMIKRLKSGNTKK